MVSLNNSAPTGSAYQEVAADELQYNIFDDQHEFLFTVFADVKGNKLQTITGTWESFVKKFEELKPVKNKIDCALIKLAKFGNKPTAKGSLRHDNNVEVVTGIEGDYDGGVVSIEKAKQLLESCGVKATFAPTFSSTPEKPMWRVLSPLDKPIKPSERLRYVEILNGMLGGILASESATLSQSYFVGVPDGADYTVISTFDDPRQGETLDQLEKIVDLKAYRQKLTKKAENNSFEVDSSFDDWVEELSIADPLHPALIRIAAHFVAKGFDDKYIKIAFAGLADRVRAIRGEDRAVVIEKEVDDAIRSAREKGFAPLSYEELIKEASSTSEDSDPDQVMKIVLESAKLDSLKKRKVWTVLRDKTKIPFSTFEETLKESIQDEDEDHLAKAQRIVKQVGDDKIIGAESYVWKWSDSGVWKKLEDRSLRQLIQSNVGDEKVTKGLIDSVSDLFKTEIFRPYHEFNIGEPECVNTPNGELVLNNGEWTLTPHNREHYRTTQIPVRFDPSAKAPRFEQFMKEVFAGDPDAEDKAKAILELMGYTLMAHCRYEKFSMLVGNGANGKSVLLDVLISLIGKENIAGVQPSNFSNSFQRAHLHGKLANIVTEIKEGQVIDDEALKGIVSGESSTVEHKFKDPFDMTPFSTCWFGTNHLPHTRDFSTGLFRRAVIVEFNNTFSYELGNCDVHLNDKLNLELSGILNLALSAYANAIKHGFTMPESCEAARKKWRVEADQVAQFVEEECNKDPEGKTPVSELYADYTMWAHAAGVGKTVTKKTFTTRLQNLGFARGHSGDVRYIGGIVKKPYVGFVAEEF